MRRDNSRKRLSRRLGEQFLASPATFLSQSRSVASQHRLRCIGCCLLNRLDRTCRLYSATLLQRLAQQQPLWGPETPSLLDTLLARFHSLRDKNLESSTEVSNLNIHCTRLGQELASLSQQAGDLTGQWRPLQEEVKRRREERANNAPKNVEHLRTELAKANRELETKNQLNASLNSKLHKLKDHLKTQQKILEDKRKEIERLRGWDSVQQEPNLTSESSPKFAQPRLLSMSVQLPTPPKRATPTSSSRKRKFEAKHRRQLKEEAQAFKQHVGSAGVKSVVPSPGNQMPLQMLSPGNQMPSPGNQMPALLSAPPPDTKWYEDTAMHAQAAEVTTSGSKKKVKFEAEAVVLNAALEGDLELLKECLKKLDGQDYSNEKGATCLHNSVCSGNFECVSYLVDQSSDINAQDIDGWTPLHCAVAYSNLVLVRYLVEHGASLFLTTRDGDTPLNIAREEHKLVTGKQAEAEMMMMAASQCLQYLQGMESGLGQLNGGVVFALFSRPAQEPGELGLNEGERLLVVQEEDSEKWAELKWWKAKNGRGQIGEIPSTYLGLYKRVRDIL